MWIVIVLWAVCMLDASSVVYIEYPFAVKNDVMHFVTLHQVERYLPLIKRELIIPPCYLFRINPGSRSNKMLLYH